MDLVAGLAVMFSSLAHLPDVASVALGSSISASMTTHRAYAKWREDRANIEGSQMFFYYDVRERLRGA